jgi:hypothetical protein
MDGYRDAVIVVPKICSGVLSLNFSSAQAHFMATGLNFVCWPLRPDVSGVGSGQEGEESV